MSTTILFLALLVVRTEKEKKTKSEYIVCEKTMENVYTTIKKVHSRFLVVLPWFTDKNRPYYLLTLDFVNHISERRAKRKSFWRQKKAHTPTFVGSRREKNK